MILQLSDHLVESADPATGQVGDLAEVDDERQRAARAGGQQLPGELADRGDVDRLFAVQLATDLSRAAASCGSTGSKKTPAPSSAAARCRRTPGARRTGARCRWRCAAGQSSSLVGR